MLFSISVFIIHSKHRSPNAARRAFLQQYKDSDRIFSYCSATSPIYYTKPLEQEEDVFTSSGIFKSIKIGVKRRAEKFAEQEKQDVTEESVFKIPKVDELDNTLDNTFGSPLEAQAGTSGSSTLENTFDSSWNTTFEGMQMFSQLFVCDYNCFVNI